MLKTSIATFGMALLFSCGGSSGHPERLQPSKPTTMEQEHATMRAVSTLTISSPAFAPMGFIPGQYTCDGANINPPLEIGNLPATAECLALIVDDPDAPGGTWEHWIVWNIPPKGQIAENTVPGVEGLNDFGKRQYGGPCPPSGVHRYFFKVYALDQLLNLPAGARKAGLENAMKGHILAQGALVGRYKRP